MTYISVDDINEMYTLKYEEYLKENYSNVFVKDLMYSIKDVIGKYLYKEAVQQNIKAYVEYINKVLEIDGELSFFNANSNRKNNPIINQMPVGSYSLTPIRNNSSTLNVVSIEKIQVKAEDVLNNKDIFLKLFFKEHPIPTFIKEDSIKMDNIGAEYLLNTLTKDSCDIDINNIHNEVLKFNNINDLCEKHIFHKENRNFTRDIETILNESYLTALEKHKGSDFLNDLLGKEDIYKARFVESIYSTMSENAFGRIFYKRDLFAYGEDLDFRKAIAIKIIMELKEQTYYEKIKLNPKIVRSAGLETLVIIDKIINEHGHLKDEKIRDYNFDGEFYKGVKLLIKLLSNQIVKNQEIIFSLIDKLPSLDSYMKYGVETEYFKDIYSLIKEDINKNKVLLLKNLDLYDDFARFLYKKELKENGIQLFETKETLTIYDNFVSWKIRDDMTALHINIDDLLYYLYDNRVERIQKDSLVNDIKYKGQYFNYEYNEANNKLIIHVNKAFYKTKRGDFIDKIIKDIKDAFINAEFNLIDFKESIGYSSDKLDLDIREFILADKFKEQDLIKSEKIKINRNKI